jgi:hypothetical protein
MKNIIIFMVAFSINLVASYSVVDDQSVGGGADGDVTVFDLSKDFDTLQVSQQNIILSIPIYVNSDSIDKEVIEMTLSSITTLKNSSNEVITTTLSYKSINGTETTISDGTSFTLLSSGEGERDGNTIEGYIYIKISSVADNATVGDYSLSSNISISSNGTTSSSSQLTVGASVALVAVAGFEDTSNQTIGKKLIGGSVNFGIFKFNEPNEVIKPLFIKNNSTQDFKISFETKPLKHIDDPDNYSIGMQYYYDGTAIQNNTKFTALSGKNDGGTKVADLKFKTDNLDDSLISGEYKTTLNITITLE